MRLHPSTRKGRILVACLLVVAAVSLVAIPTLHSAVTVRMYADEVVLNPLPLTGWGGIGFPVSAGDAVTLQFETHNGTFDVRLRFGPELGSDRESTYPYDATNVTSDTFKFTVPKGGSVEIAWRPWATGQTVFRYEVRVVPNPTGLSLAS